MKYGPENVGNVNGRLKFTEMLRPTFSRENTDVARYRNSKNNADSASVIAYPTGVKLGVGQ